MNLVIFGPPGAGKGTQSKFIVKKYNLHQLSTGEILRQEIINKTQLGLEISSIMNSGNLVSDTVVSDLIEKFISNGDYKNRLIFDGYPRNKQQAENLGEELTTTLNSLNSYISEIEKTIVQYAASPTVGNLTTLQKSLQILSDFQIASLMSC